MVEMTFKEKAREGEYVKHVDIWGKSILAKGTASTRALRPKNA